MSQMKEILIDLLKGRKLTAMDALKRYQCFRLASRIKEIRQLGFDVITERVTLANGKRVAKYRLEKKEAYKFNISKKCA